MKQNRRTFLQKSSLAFWGYTFIPKGLGVIKPSDKVRIAVIGTGNMGTNHLEWFSNLPEADVVAIADVDLDRQSKALNNLKQWQPQVKVDTYNDFRKILERADIDAISCATPDHWHAQVAALAFEAGKDVYGEKPLSYSVAEGQMMLKYQQKNNRIFQLGTQIHATDNYHRVVELIQGNAIGKVHTIRLWKTGGPPVMQATRVSGPPQSLDWDRWLGLAPQVDYLPERCHGTFRYFLDYSGGVYADFWCHIADVAFWACQPSGLKTIEAKGEKADGIADTPGWINVDFAFDNLNLHWTTEPPPVPGAADMHIGAYFEGEKGSLICDYNTRKLTIDGEIMDDLDHIPVSITRSPGHQQNFIDSVKSRQQPESNLAYARQMTLPMHLGLISWRLGRKLTWDPQEEKFIGDAVADKLLKRKNRKKWQWIK